MTTHSSKLAILGVAGALLASTMGPALAQEYRDHRGGYGNENGYRHDRHRHGGLGVGGAVAAGVLGGAALGVAGAYGAERSYGYDGGYNGDNGYYNNGY